MNTDTISPSDVVSYIALEGDDGSGKSTQARLLAERIGAVLTREPGGTPLGARLRQILLTPGNDLDPRTEALLMAADRAQHMQEVIRPALTRGNVVVSDRSAYSSLAYQGAGRSLGFEEVQRVNGWALDGLWPDLVVYLRCDDLTIQSRLGAKSRDRFEQEGSPFQQRVRLAYENMAIADPSWVTINANGTIEEVSNRIWEAVNHCLPEQDSFT